MPANLPPDYFAAEKRFREASTIPAKIAALEELIRTVPKHKGTDKLRADLRRKLSQLRLDQEKRGKGGAHHDFVSVERAGAAQLALAGFPNTGKSSLVSLLTHAHSEVAEYPLTTHTPVSGMMPFEDIQFQLVDLPPIGNEPTDGWVGAIFRNADLILVVVDLSGDPVMETGMVLDHLDSLHMRLAEKNETVPKEDFHHVKTAILAANKLDLPGARAQADRLTGEFGNRFPVIPLSCREGTNLEELKRAVFLHSGVIRIYAKKPGKEPDYSSPFTLRKGTTVIELATHIHKEMGERLQFARVWGSSRFEGQKVERHFVLSDRDVVEIHL